MIMCSVLISYCVCRRPSWKPKTQPNDSRAAVWLSFWFQTPFGFVFGLQLDSLLKHLITLALVTFTPFTSIHPSHPIPSIRKLAPSGLACKSFWGNIVGAYLKIKCYAYSRARFCRFLNLHGIFFSDFQKKGYIKLKTRRKKTSLELNVCKSREYGIYENYKPPLPTFKLMSRSWHAS